jgi:hypothetical protein
MQAAAAAPSAVLGSGPSIGLRGAPNDAVRLLGDVRLTLVRSPELVETKTRRGRGRNAREGTVRCECRSRWTAGAPCLLARNLNTLPNMDCGLDRYMLDPAQMLQGGARGRKCRSKVGGGLVDYGGGRWERIYTWPHTPCTHPGRRDSQPRTRHQRGKRTAIPKGAMTSAHRRIDSFARSRRTIRVDCGRLESGARDGASGMGRPGEGWLGWESEGEPSDLLS